MTSSKTFLPAFALIAVVAAQASAETIHETGDPFGGFIGILGYDVFQNQSVGARFTIGAKATDFRLDRLQLWIWNNDDTGGQPQITVTLRTDDADGGSIPGEEVLEAWTLNVPNTGVFNPILIEFASVQRPVLEAGRHYWVVGESAAAATLDPVWALAAEEVGIYSTTDFFSGDWMPAVNGPVPAMIVEGSPIIPGDINGDGTVGVADLLLLLAAWGPCPSPPAQCPADVNADGNTGTLDLLLLLGNWG